MTRRQDYDRASAEVARQIVLENRMADKARRRAVRPEKGLPGEGGPPSATPFPEEHSRAEATNNSPPPASVAGPVTPGGDEDGVVDELLPWMPADQIPLFRRAVAAVLDLAAVRKEDPFDTLWWVFACPMHVVKASYADYYGTRHVWTVTIEHPAHAARTKR